MLVLDHDIADRVRGLYLARKEASGKVSVKMSLRRERTVLTVVAP